ncbi:MAG: N-acetyltransferase, partial [Alphaproteobacteria bacterium]|nr:N-acetyltransferase [Alphaproteobacteria bacterium]
GEYVFDHGWAEAFARAGGQYYPKLQVSVPFTPAMGPRLLVDPVHPDPAWARRALLTAATQRCEQIGASSIHITFPTEPEWTAMGEAGLLQRTGVQFHWENDNYADFDAFLATLSSRKRKQIKKERREALPEGLTITALSGDEIKEHHWDAFFVFYQENGARKWGTPYLTRTFFSLLGERMGDQVVLVMAERDGRPIAGALNLMGDGTLYGRNWGCIEDHRFLHFEACYYQAIDYAIKHGLGRVEAGAQGPHKLARGYLPITTYSAHWITHPGLREAIGQYLEREVNEVDWEIEALSKHSPYRKPD